VVKFNLEQAQFICISRVKVHEDIMPKTEEYLVETADRCTRLAHEGRGLIARLEAISNELLAKAVELNTTRQKNQKSSGGADK